MKRNKKFDPWNTAKNMEMKSSSSWGSGILVMALFLFWLTGCEVTGEAGSSKTEHANTLSIATWNIQTLFDGDEIGTEYNDYLVSAGWTGEKYESRLTALSQAIEQLTEKTPDILCLIEIENSQVLESLIKGHLSKQGYDWTFFGNNPGSALGIGIISRFPFEQTIIHSITCNGETVPRPILEIRLQVQNEPLVIFVCHWKSKREGIDITEASRKASARIIQRRLRELQVENPVLPVIITGDLNENHDEFYREHVIGALIPDDPVAAALTGFTSDIPDLEPAMDFLVLSHTKPPESHYFSAETGILYSPWEHELQEGSYYYKNQWETIDHFLLSAALFDQTGWDFDSCMVIKQEPFINSKGYPAAYNPRTGNGLSDHLPLVLTLKNTRPVQKMKPLNDPITSKP